MVTHEISASPTLPHSTQAADKTYLHFNNLHRSSGKSAREFADDCTLVRIPIRSSGNPENGP